MNDIAHPEELNRNHCPMEYICSTGDFGDPENCIEPDDYKLCFLYKHFATYEAKYDVNLGSMGNHNPNG